MRKNMAGLLSQFGFGINNDLLALIICVVAFAAAMGVLLLVGAL
jgi:hypothetical protein